MSIGAQSPSNLPEAPQGSVGPARSGTLIKTISKGVAWGLTRPALRKALRLRHRLGRKLGGKTAVVHYFHQADDPYSHLCVQVLERLSSAYRIRLEAHLVDAPADSAAPDRIRLGLWSRRDSAQLARAHALDAPEGFMVQFSPTQLTLAERALTQALGAPDFARRAVAIGSCLWRAQGQDEPALASVAEALAAKMTGNALRDKLGHYLGAMFQFDGEWYWGLDRLHHLEQRLIDEGLVHDPAQAVLFPPRLLQWLPLARPARAPQLHFFCSFRSPYTYLAVARVRQLAAHYGAEVCLRPVLPMVMRGLAVPRQKRFYIVSDVAREAHCLGLDYGLMVDPLGRGVERGYAVLAWAMNKGLGMDFAEAFLRGVWSQGIDAASDDGLCRMARVAGITAAEVQGALSDDSWRATAELNRQELLSMDLWGVPSFRVNDEAGQWGQDRLWLIEQDLVDAIKT